jgi:capsular polysaccharide biosynthesis protein
MTNLERKDPFRTFRAIARRLGLRRLVPPISLVVPLVLWLTATAAAWFFINKEVWPDYEASSLIQVSPSGPNLFSDQQTTDTLGDAQFIREQVALISSPSVLLNATLQPKIAEIPEIRDSASPPDLLKSKLTVENIPETTLIRVSYLSKSPMESQYVVEGIVEQYLKFVTFQSASSQVKLRSNLEQFAEEIERDYREKYAGLIKFARDLKKPGVVPVGDKDSLTSFSSLTEELHRTAAERLIQVDIDLAVGSSKTDELKKTRAYLRTLLSMPVTDGDDARIDLLWEEIESRSRKLDTIRRKIQELEFDSKGEARVFKVAETLVPEVPIRDRRVPLMALSSFGILCLVLAIGRIGLFPARLATVES